jgi:hypothetical protein
MPYRVRMGDALGSFLYRLLRDQLNDSKYDKMLHQYTVKYTVKLHKKQVFNEGARNLTSETIYRFNVFAEELFSKELFSYLAQCKINFETTKDIYSFKNSPFTIKTGIFQFLAKYNIDPQELSYQTLQKRYYRFRQELQNNKVGRLSTNKKGGKSSFGDIRLSA